MPDATQTRRNRYRLSVGDNAVSETTQTANRTGHVCTASPKTMSIKSCSVLYRREFSGGAQLVPHPILECRSFLPPRSA